MTIPPVPNVGSRSPGFAAARTPVSATVAASMTNPALLLGNIRLLAGDCTKYREVPSIVTGALARSGEVDSDPTRDGSGQPNRRSAPSKVVEYGVGRRTRPVGGESRASIAFPHTRSSVEDRGHHGTHEGTCSYGEPTTAVPAAACGTDDRLVPR